MTIVNEVLSEDTENFARNMKNMSRVSRQLVKAFAMGLSSKEALEETLDRQKEKQEAPAEA